MVEAIQIEIELQDANQVWRKMLNVSGKMREEQRKKTKEDEAQLLRERRRQVHMKRKMIEEVERHGFFLELTKEEFENSLYMFYEGGTYERIEVVMGSGAFISALPLHMFPQYPLRPLGPNTVDGGSTATGQEVHILREKRLQV